MIAVVNRLHLLVVIINAYDLKLILSNSLVLNLRNHVGYLESGVFYRFQLEAREELENLALFAVALPAGVAGTA